MNSKLFTKKILTLITAIALFVGVGLVYGFTSADESNLSLNTNHTRAIQTWYFTGNSLTNVNDTTFYNVNPSSESCDDTEELPCQIQFEANDYLLPSTNTPLQNYLNAHTSTWIRDNAAATKSVQ